MERFLRHRPCGGRAARNGVDKSAPRRPSLTISRQCGAGLSRFDHLLLEYLDELEGSPTCGWVLFDQSLIGTLLEQGRMTESAPPFDAAAAKFRVAPVLGENLSRPASQWTLFHHSANAIRLLCLEGNVVVVGRAGNHLTADLPNTFHVRLVSEKGTRVAYLARRHGLAAEEAEQLADETDKARERFVKRHAGAEIGDPLGYHLVVNTNHFGDEGAMRVIADSLHEWTQQWSATAPRAAAGNILEGHFH